MNEDVTMLSMLGVVALSGVVINDYCEPVTGATPRNGD